MSPDHDAATPAAAPPSVDEMVRELWDRQQISDVMLRFGRTGPRRNAPTSWPGWSTT
jgi:hypothetical protein